KRKRKKLECLKELKKNLKRRLQNKRKKMNKPIKFFIQSNMSYLLSPVSPVPNEFPDVGNKWKERNDRQLRLWGLLGQDRIDQANVCLLNATALGSEILKNL